MHAVCCKLATYRLHVAYNATPSAMTTSSYLGMANARKLYAIFQASTWWVQEVNAAKSEITANNV